MAHYLFLGFRLSSESMCAKNSCIRLLKDYVSSEQAMNFYTVRDFLEGETSSKALSTVRSRALLEGVVSTVEERSGEGGFQGAPSPLSRIMSLSTLT
jgi:hypothetical protein